MKLHIALTGIAMILGHAVTASAVPIELSRETTTTVLPGAPGTFAGASFDYQNAVHFDTDPGTLNTTLSIQPVATNIQIQGLGASVTSIAGVPDGTLSTPVSITGDVSGNGGWSFSYQGPASNVPGQSFITNAIILGRHALVFSGGGSNFVGTGGTFHSVVQILGDFSDAASHTPVTFGAGYTLQQDFAFDGTYTIVDVITTNYQGTNPGINFTLLGDAVVPSPGVLPLLLASLLGLFVVRGRRIAN